jgi:hypothetical protein
MLTTLIVSLLLAKPTPLKMPTLKTQVEAPADCSVDESFGTYIINCGPEDRTDYKLFVSEWLATDPMQPKTADAAAASAKSLLEGAEFKVLEKSTTKGGWKVSYVASTKGSTAYGAQLLRPVGKKSLLCTASADGEAQLKKAVALCGSLKATK